MNKIITENDWEYMRYYLDGEEIKPGDILLITMPDGSKHQLTTKESTYGYTEGDMGHDYHGTARRLYVQLSCYGMTKNVSLEDEEILVERIEQQKPRASTKSYKEMATEIKIAK